MQTYKFRNEFTVLSKKLEDATKINLKTCMKCRTNGSNFVNKIRMQFVFLLHRTPIQKQVEKNRQFTFVRLSFWHKNAPFRQFFYWYISIIPHCLTKGEHFNPIGRFLLCTFFVNFSSDCFLQKTKTHAIPKKPRNCVGFLWSE